MTMATADKALRQGHQGREAHELRAHDDRALADRQLVLIDEALERACGETPRGRRPGTRRAERGRSRQPVASKIAPAWDLPQAARGLAIATVDPSCQPVTVVAVRISSPAVCARRT